MRNSLLSPNTEKKLKETLKQGPKRASTLDDDKRRASRPQDQATTSPKAGAASPTFVRKLSILDQRRSLTRKSNDFSLSEFSDTREVRASDEVRSTVFADLGASKEIAEPKNFIEAHE